MFMQAEEQWFQNFGEEQIKRFMEQEWANLGEDKYFCAFLEGIETVGAEFESSTDFS